MRQRFKRQRGAVVFASVALAFGLLGAGCVIGDDFGGNPGGDGDGDGDGDGEIERVPSSDPGADDRLDTLGILCESTLLVTGTFEETQPKPADISGCWGAGIWTVNVAIDFQGCAPQPAFASTFRYEVSRTGEDSTELSIEWLDSTEAEESFLDLSGDGGGCQASFEHLGYDGESDVDIVLHPSLGDDGSLSGGGEWTLYLSE